MEGMSCFRTVVFSAVVLMLFVHIYESRHLKRSPKSNKGIHHEIHHKAFPDKKKREEIPGEMEVDGTKFKSIGCFRDAWNRVIPALEGEHQLLMEPNYKARTFALLKCARAAIDKHLKIFGIENGGQCFGADAENSLDKYGTAVECRRDGKGGPWSLQAYKFATLPINGGFSPWSRWTTCSKTCDHGVRRRMRTCTNPPPSNGGKDCSGLGPSVEGEICKDKECPAVLIDEVEAANTLRPTTPVTTPTNKPVVTAETNPPTITPIKDKEKTNEKSNSQSQAQTQTKDTGSALFNKPNSPSKDVGETNKITNVQNEKGNANAKVNESEKVNEIEKVNVKPETSSQSTLLQKDKEKTSPPGPSKEVNELHESANVQNPKVPTKVESTSQSSPTQSDKQKSTSSNSKTETNSKEDDKKPKSDSGASQNEKPVTSQTSASQESSQTGFHLSHESSQTGSQVYQDPGQIGSQVYKESSQTGSHLSQEPSQTGSQVYQQSGQTSSQTAPGSEPYQFIDEPEDQRESNNNLYSMSSMHQSEDLKAHDQANLPGTSQDIYPSNVEDTYNGGPVVPSSAVQLNTPLGPVVMGEVSPVLNNNFNPAEIQNDQPANDECFCPKKVCDAKADVVFLVDGSSDIPQVYFAHVLDFIKALTRGFSAKDTQVSLVAYGDDAASAFGFSSVSNIREIDDSIDSVSYMGGEPRTGNALMKVKNGVFGMNSRNDASHALVLLTSGSSSDDTIQAATELRDAGIKLTTVGLGKLANVKELIDISSDPKSSHVFTAFLDTLPDIMDDIVKGVCSDVKGKLYDKTDKCICESNKAKDAKQNSPATSSGNGGSTNSQKGSPTTKPNHTSDTSSGNKNQSKPHSSDFKGSTILNEKSKGEQSNSNESSNKQLPKATDSQSSKNDSKSKDTSKETTTGAGVKILKLPSELRPSLSQEKPSQSQEKPSQSQEKPSQSSEKPSQSQEKPSQSQEKPSQSQEKPSQSQENTSQSQEKPSQSQEKPSQSSEKPSQSQEKPSQSQEKPSQSPEKPSQSSEKPSQSPEKPSQSSEKPSQSQEKPSQSSEKPSQSQEKPSQSSEKPSQSPEKPSQSPEKPSQSSEKPSQSPEKPSQSQEKPSQSQEKPSQSPEKPSQSPEKPSQSQEKPSQSQEKPSQSQEKPSQSQEKPSQSSEEPSQSQEKPSQSQEKPSQSSEEPSQSQEKPSQQQEKPSQSQEKVSQSQEEAPSSQEKQSSSKESTKNTPVQMKTDFKVNAPVPQGDKNEKAVPKKDENKGKINSNNPSQVTSESSSNSDKGLTKISPANEEPMGSKDGANNKNEEKPSESNKESIKVSDNNNSETSKATSQTGLVLLTPGEQTKDTSQKEPNIGDITKATEQDQEIEIPSAAETTSESPPSPDKPTEPQPLNEQQESPSTEGKERKSESNTLDKTTDSTNSKESGQSEPIPEKILEATESSFPPGNTTKPKEQQPQKSTDHESQGQNSPETNKSSEVKDLKNEKMIAQQVEIPNPSSKEPKEPATTVQDNKSSSEEKKDESGKQNTQREANPYTQSQVPPSQTQAPPPSYSMLSSRLPEVSGSSEKSQGGDAQLMSMSGTMVDLSSLQQQKANFTDVKNTDSSMKDCSVNLGVVLDSKTTAYGDDSNAKKLLQFSKKVTHMFPVSPEGNRVGMMVYSGSPKLKVVHFDHSLDADTMDKAIDSASYLNMEIKTGRVLNFAQEHLFSRIPSSKQNVLLLITDGVSYDDVTNPSLQLKRRGVEIFVIGVGDNVVRKELESIASGSPDDHVIMTSYDFSDALLDDIKNRICSSAERKGGQCNACPNRSRLVSSELHAELKRKTDILYSKEASLPRRRGHLYRVLTEIDRRRKRND